MAWIQFSVDVAADQVNSIIQGLEALGAQATTQQNAGEQSYYDLAHPAEPKWDLQTVTALFEARDKGESLRRKLEADVRFGVKIELKVLENRDWETAWLDGYEAIEITPDLWVFPDWIQPGPEIKTTVRINPGMAFGTGTHETTRLCMRALTDISLNARTVLDYGCGSGILAITALKLGASFAVGVDIDPKAESVSRENAVINGVASRFAIQSAGDVSAQTFDVVIANILSYALIDLASSLIACTNKGGRIILSGILDHQANEVIAAYQHKFDFEQIREAGWLVLIGRNRSLDGE